MFRSQIECEVVVDGLLETGHSQGKIKGECCAIGVNAYIVRIYMPKPPCCEMVVIAHVGRVDDELNYAISAQLMGRIACIWDSYIMDTISNNRGTYQI